MKILIAGGTGFVGRALTSELRARGHDVIVLSRTPDDGPLADGVSTVAADVTDATAVDTAVAETVPDAIVNLVALSPLFEPSGGDEAHERIHCGGTEHLVAAAESHGVERFLQMSALGADPDGPTHYVRAKGRAERVVRDSSLDWTIVRPSVVFGDGGEFVGFTKLLTTPYLTGLPGGGKTRFQPIWVDDLVGMLADCLEDDAHVGETYELGGPEVLTLADVAKAVYGAAGKPLVVLPVPMLFARIGLTIAGWLPFVPMGPDQYRSLRFDNTVSDNDIEAFGRSASQLRRLDDYLDGDGDDENARQEAETTGPGRSPA